MIPYYHYSITLTLDQREALDLLLARKSEDWQLEPIERAALRHVREGIREEGQQAAEPVETAAEPPADDLLAIGEELLRGDT